MGKLLSLTEYAQKVGRDRSYINRALNSGSLKGEKLGSQWVIDEDEQIHYVRPLRKPIENNK